MSVSFPPSWRWVAGAVLIGGLALTAIVAVRTGSVAHRKAPAAVALPASVTAVHPAPRTAATNETGPVATAFDAALADLRSRLGPDASPDTVMAQLAAIAQRDPALAIDLAQALGRNDAEKAAWVTDLAQTWATRAPEDAWRWLSQLTSDRQRELADGTVPELIITTLARNSSDLLVRNLDQLVRNGEGPTGVAPVVAVHLAVDALTAGHHVAEARAAVEAWARDPAHPNIGESAFLDVATAMSQTSPTEASTWLTSLPPSEQRDIALVEFPAHWGVEQPRAALAWAEQNLPPNLRGDGIHRAFSEWVERSPAAAGEWLGEYLSRVPADPHTDRLISDLVNLGAAVQMNPELARQWTALINDPDARRAQEERIRLRLARAE